VLSYGQGLSVRSAPLRDSNTLGLHCFQTKASIMGDIRATARRTGDILVIVADDRAKTVREVRIVLSIEGAQKLTSQIESALIAADVPARRTWRASKAQGVSSPLMETIQFALVRGGNQIGTHVIEIRRSGPETLVKTTIDLSVQVFFITVYRLKHTATERWVTGHLVSLNSSTDDNGTPHTVRVTQTPTGLEIVADGTVTHADKSLVPMTLWNTQLLTRTVALNAQDGQIIPLSVIDNGAEQLTVKGRVFKANRYTLKTNYTQDVWYDDQARPVKASFIAPDGSAVVSHLL